MSRSNGVQAFSQDSDRECGKPNLEQSTFSYSHQTLQTLPRRCHHGRRSRLWSRTWTPVNVCLRNLARTTWWRNWGGGLCVVYNCVRDLAGAAVGNRVVTAGVKSVRKKRRRSGKDRKIRQKRETNSTNGVVTSRRLAPDGDGSVVERAGLYVSV